MAKRQPAKNSSKAATPATTKKQEEPAKEVATPDETANTTPEPAADTEQENAQPSAEPPTEEQTEQAEKPGYDLSPEEQTEEQKEYVVQFNRFIDLHDGQMPNEKLSTDQLREANEKREQENAQPPVVEKAVTAASAKAKKAKSDKTHVMLKNKKTGEIRRVKRVTWELLKKSPGGFEEIQNVPQEVKNLNKKKGGK